MSLVPLGGSPVHLPASLAVGPVSSAHVALSGTIAVIRWGSRGACPVGFVLAVTLALAVLAVGDRVAAAVIAAVAGFSVSFLGRLPCG